MFNEILGVFTQINNNSEQLNSNEEFSAKIKCTFKRSTKTFSESFMKLCFSSTYFKGNISNTYFDEFWNIKAKL